MDASCQLVGVSESMGVLVGVLVGTIVGLLWIPLRPKTPKRTPVWELLPQWCLWVLGSDMHRCFWMPTFLYVDQPRLVM